MHPMIARGRMSRSSLASGFVLIEVLISVLIFAVGVLALVGLQVSMTRAQTESKIRADAAYLASELVGLMWSDVSNVAKYSTADCASHPQCNSWKSKVEHALPSGGSTVSVTTTAGNDQGKVNIEISWTSTSGDAHKYKTEAMVKKAGET